MCYFEFEIEHSSIVFSNSERSPPKASNGGVRHTFSLANFPRSEEPEKCPYPRIRYQHVDTTRILRIRGADTRILRTLLNPLAGQGGRQLPPVPSHGPLHFQGSRTCLRIFFVNFEFLPMADVSTHVGKMGVTFFHAVKSSKVTLKKSLFSTLHESQHLGSNLHCREELAVFHSFCSLK
jgi:hypothetical protein